MTLPGLPQGASFVTLPPTEPGWSVPVAPSVLMVPAHKFTFEHLVAAYNQTRVDYIVPMPMNADRLREYVHTYNVLLDCSVVALEDEQILGLSMLGVRGNQTWITRLGVLPVKRRRGTGQLLMENHLEQSRTLGARQVWLEVIKNNAPAYELFRKLGFSETRELLVLRRPPGPTTALAPEYTATFLNSAQAIALLWQRKDNPNWLNQTQSLLNAGHLEGLRVDLPDGSWGWVVFQHTLYQLGRLTLQPEVGDFDAVLRALLHALHSRHPRHDTKHENMSLDDPRWPVLQEFGYLISFRRIEMRLDL